MKRIHRLEVSVIENGEVLGSYKWTRGTENIKIIYGNDMFNNLRLNFSYDDLLGMVQECRDGSNVIYVVDNNTDIEVRHWSYNRKG